MKSKRRSEPLQLAQTYLQAPDKPYQASASERDLWLARFPNYSYLRETLGLTLAACIAGRQIAARDATPNRIEITV